jgi:hypothetical protein
MRQWRLCAVDNGQPKLEPPLRAVLDTDVMISGLFGQGTLTATIYTFWVTRVEADRKIRRIP